MNQLAKTTEKQPTKLLQGANIPKEYIENIRQLIWTNDPANELIALELVIHHGLPKELVIDFIVAAKKGRNMASRDKIRDFLVDNLTDGAKKILNSRTVIMGSSISFYHYEKLITHSEIARLAAAYYRRDGRSECLPAFFRYDDGTSPHRQEMLAHLLPSFLSRPTFLKIHVNLTVKELNQVLANPAFKGKLERLVISSKLMKTIPEEIFKHQTIKNLELRGAFEATTLPLELFDLNQLNRLNLWWKNLKYIPTEISRLSQLKEIHLKNNYSLRLPVSLKQLTQLESAIFSNGMEESIAWTAAMPTVKFQ